MLKWFTKVQTTGGNERYVSLPVHFRWNLRQKIYPEKILLHQTIRRENSGGVRSVNLGRILILWPDRTEMAINCQKKAQLLRWKVIKFNFGIHKNRLFANIHYYEENLMMKNLWSRTYRAKHTHSISYDICSLSTVYLSTRLKIWFIRILLFYFFSRFPD